MFAIMTVFNRKILKTLIKIKNKSGRDSLRTVFINHQTDVKSFDCMPGPLSLPLIGTLYNYCPLIGETTIIYYIQILMMTKLHYQARINSIGFT